MAAEHGLQVLPGAEPAPEPAAVPEHHGEQPDLPHDAGLVVELHPELGEIDLSLAPRRRLEPTLERLRLRRPNRSQEIGDDAVAAVVAELPDLAQQALPGEVGIGDEALAQVGLDPVLPKVGASGKPGAVHRVSRARIEADTLLLMGRSQDGAGGNRRRSFVHLQAGQHPKKFPATLGLHPPACRHSLELA